VNGVPAETLVPIDTSVPNMARVYDFLLGGSHNFAADRRVAEAAMAHVPHAVDAARLNRSFLRRVALFMIDNGIRQFLDIGSGIPTVGNVHEIAQGADPTVPAKMAWRLGSAGGFAVRGPPQLRGRTLCVSVSACALDHSGA
jgi:hypothetical protein